MCPGSPSLRICDPWTERPGELCVCALPICRRSSMAPGAGGRKPNDPRNISDKKFKDAAIKKLIQYLAEHGYDRAISTQILTAPSAKEFVYILSFLLKNAIPNFKFGAKYEDDVPVVLKALGYPYTISKGALSAVGTPHTWPHLLAALSWLVDLLKVLKYPAPYYPNLRSLIQRSHDRAMVVR